MAHAAVGLRFSNVIVDEWLKALSQCNVKAISMSGRSPWWVKDGTSLVSIVRGRAVTQVNPWERLDAV
jgi:hypothetical protein